MKIGFTGTQEGMNFVQLRAFAEFLQDNPSITELHHGDCIGADMDAHALFAGYTTIGEVIIHPPSDNKKRAFCKSDHILPAKPYLERNHDIVDACDVLLAAPRSSVEEQRSGTWATVRYARKMRKRIVMLVRE